MKKWLKFTFLSFFSNKCAETGKELKFSNVLISFLLFSVVLPLFLSLGFNFNIDYTYITQDNFKNALSHTFVTNKINYTYQDNKLSTNLIVNTFDNESDSPYIYGDFDFIIDTRSYQFTYDDFIFTAKDKQGNQVTYTPKLKDDINFVFEFAYSGKEFDLTTKLNDCYTYLNDICDHESVNYNISARADYEELERNKNTYFT